MQNIIQPDTVTAVGYETDFIAPNFKIVLPKRHNFYKLSYNSMILIELTNGLVLVWY